MPSSPDDSRVAGSVPTRWWIRSLSVLIALSAVPTAAAHGESAHAGASHVLLEGIALAGLLLALVGVVLYRARDGRATAALALVVNGLLFALVGTALLLA